MNVSAPLLLLLLAACVVSGGLLPRALWQLSSTIMCHQPGVNPFRYIDYGCWCGLRSKGPPQDDVDLCCKVHDNCYEMSSKAPGCTAIADLPVVIVYDYTCSDQQVTCSATNNKCQAAACECDRAAARCFAQAKYNPEYKNMDPKVHCVE